VLGIDIRDTTTLAVLVDADGGVVARGTHDGSDAPAAAAAARAALIGEQRPEGLGVVSRDAGTPTGVTIDSGLNIPGPAAVVTPGAGLALAEQWCGAARGATHVVALSLDECVHAGIVIHGRLFGGAHGLAGAAGWLALNPVEREDYRKFGCLEAEVGEAGIVRRLVWRIKAGDRSRVLEMAGGNVSAITASHVFECARQGDGVAISVVRDTAKYIGMAVANLVAIVDPEVVVLGGRMSEAGDLVLEPARVEMSRRVSPMASQRVAILPTALGDASAAIGAARAAMLAAQ
jgi:predicted NBD/HSP70 family sugar kinase